MKEYFKKMRDLLWAVEQGDDNAYYEMEQLIDEAEGSISSDTIVEWFQSPFVADFDKKKALEQANKIKL